MTESEKYLEIPCSERVSPASEVIGDLEGTAAEMLLTLITRIIQEQMYRSNSLSRKDLLVLETTAFYLSQTVICLKRQEKLLPLGRLDVYVAQIEQRVKDFDDSRTYSLIKKIFDKDDDDDSGT